MIEKEIEKDLKNNKENIFKKIGRLNPINKIKSKKIRIVIYIILIIILINLILKLFAPKNNNSFNYDEVEAEVGDVNVVISGSGSIEPIEQYDITALVQGEILEDYFEEGQILQKDDLMYSIDSKDIQNNIERASLAVERAQSNYTTALSTTQIKSSSNGIITNMNVKVGDQIMQGAKVADVLDSSSLRLVLQYNYIDTKSMYVGQVANVIVENGFYNVTGYVSKISSNQVINESGMGISYVEIKVNNPGAITDKDFGIAQIGNIRSNNSNTFEYMNKATIYSTGSGYIKSIDKLMGDYVTSGETIITIGNDTLDEQVKQSQLALKDAELSLKNAQDQLDNYNLKAPISGKVILKNNKKGDILSSTSSISTMGTSKPLAIIADMDTIKFTVKVDELEISKIQKGQSVLITVDALDGKEYTGYVDNINIVGTVLNGVTTYDVKVIVNNPEGLLPGMNVDADIQIIYVEDVVRVPLSAVMKGNFVYIKDSNPNYQDKDSKVPKGYRKISVEIGENDSEYIEIKSGINKGDKVLVEKLKQSGVFNFGAGMNGMHSEM